MQDKPEQNELISGLINLAELLLKNIKWIAGVVLVVMVVTAVILVMTPNKYKSRASILPTGKSDKLSALKAITGVRGNMFETDQNSSALFPEILRSNQVRDAVINRTYTFSHNSQKMSFTLKEYLGSESPEILRYALGPITFVTVDRNTGVLSIAVETEFPELSQKILQATLTELENYNLNIRRSQAKESERYLARELKAREKELNESEERLEEFQKANRNWYNTSDPEILVTLGRFQRGIEINTQTYALLREQYELARLNVQKDIPIVRILDSPSLPTIKSSPQRTMATILSGIVAFILSFGFIIIVNIFRKTASESNCNSLDSLSYNLNRAFPVVNWVREKRKVLTRTERSIPEKLDK